MAEKLVPYDEKHFSLSIEGEKVKLHIEISRACLSERGGRQRETEREREGERGKRRRKWKRKRREEK